MFVTGNDGRATIDGKKFRSADAVVGGEVTADTLFEYHEDAGVIWGRYEGGAVRLGFLVGTRSGDELEFRYAQVNRDGDTATGYCQTVIELLDDGRLRLHETWRWESRDGHGTSVVEEVEH